MLIALLLVLAVQPHSAGTEPPRYDLCPCRQAGGPPCDCVKAGDCGAVICPVGRKTLAAPPPPDPEAERLRIAVEVAIAIAKARKPVVPKVDPTPGDPYGVLSYDLFHGKIVAGFDGMLVVGIKDEFISSYWIHCRVPSGFGGLADGNWYCYAKDGKAVMEPWKGFGVKPRPFLPGTVVPSAGFPSSVSPAPVQYRAPTFTLMQPGTVGGITTVNCAVG